MHENCTQVYKDGRVIILLYVGYFRTHGLFHLPREFPLLQLMVLSFHHDSRLPLSLHRSEEGTEVAASGFCLQRRKWACLESVREDVSKECSVCFTLLSSKSHPKPKHNFLIGFNPSNKLSSATSVYMWCIQFDSIHLGRFIDILQNKPSTYVNWLHGMDILGF